MSANEEQDRFRLRILTPDRAVLDTEVGRVTATSLEGVFEVLPGHEAVLAPLVVGLLAVTKPGESGETLYAIHGGFLEVRGGTATILADAAESGDEVDLERAREARSRAEDRLQRQTDQPQKPDVDRARAALMRAITRIQAVEKQAFVE
jgi:F-type H+-transporting ATPase subunit epsilon